MTTLLSSNLGAKVFPSRHSVAKRLAGTAILIAALLPAAGSFGQSDFPSRPMRFVVGFTPGGTSDMVGRALGELLADSLGQSVVIDNRPGASGRIAAELVATAPADGYTLLLTSGSYTVAPSLYRRLPFDIQRDFIHITRIANTPFVLAVAPKLPAKSLQELVAYARGNPGKVNFASAGVGSPSHLAGELLGQMANLKLTHIPYKGSALAMIDLIASRVQFYFTSIPGALAHIAKGSVRPLAVTSTKRNVALPEIPTVVESGLKGYRAGSWYGVAVPRGVPTRIVKRISDGIQKGLSGGLEAKLAAQGLEMRRNVTAKEAAAIVREDVAYWATVIRRAGIKPR